MSQSESIAGIHLSHELILIQVLESRLSHELNRFKYWRHRLSDEVLRIKALEWNAQKVNEI